MNNAKKYLKFFMSVFTSISTGICIITAIMFSADSSVSEWEGLRYIPLQILCAAFVTSIVTVICIIPSTIDREYRQSEFIIRTVIHYILINISIYGLGYLFGWFVLSLSSFISMLVSVGMVYAFVYAINYFNNKTSADDLNKALGEMKNNE